MTIYTASPPLERKLKHSAALLQDIVDGLKNLERNRLDTLEVRFWTRRDKVSEVFYCFTLRTALDAICNDTYWDERGDWSNAERATVEVK